MVHFDVSGIKPNQVPYLETRDGEVAISRMSFILLEGELKLITKVLMQVLHVCSHFMSTLQWNRFKGNLKFRMELLRAVPGLSEPGVRSGRLRSSDGRGFSERVAAPTRLSHPGF